MNWNFVTDVLAVMGGGIILWSAGRAVLRSWAQKQLKDAGIAAEQHVCISCMPVEGIKSLFDKLDTPDDKFYFLCWVNHYRPSIMAEQFVHEFAKLHPKRFGKK